jgi:ABC-type amino acid transport substrate-binding protein
VQPVPLAGDVLAAMRARGELLVCATTDQVGLSWRNPRNSEMEGLDTDMARALANRLGLTLRFVETGLIEFIERLESRGCDIAMLGAAILPGRQERVAFSKPYLSSAAYAVAPRESPRVRRWEEIDAPGHVVALAAGSGAEPAMRASLRHAALLVVQPPRSREAEVAAGRADVLIADLAAARRFQTDESMRVMEPPERFGEVLYAYAVVRGDAAWLAEVNAFLNDSKSDGTLARAAARQGLGSAVVR